MTTVKKVGRVHCPSGQLLVVDAETLRAIDNAAYIALVNSGVVLPCQEKSYNIYTEETDDKIEVKLLPETEKAD